MKLKKTFLFITILISAFFIFSKNSLAKSYEYERISVEININKDGSFDVEEEMSLVLDGSFGFFNRELSMKSLDYISDIEVYGDDGRILDKSEYEISGSSGRKKIQWDFIRRNFLSEQKKWTVKYKVHGGLGFYKDHDELYWNAIFSDRDVNVKKAEVLVRLPESQDMKKMTAAMYSEQKMNGFIKRVLSQTEYYFEAHNLKPQTNFTIAAGWPKGIFDYKKIFLSYWFSWHRILGILLPILTFIIMFIIWNNKGRDPKIDKTIIAEYEPPTDLYPAEMEVLIKEKVSMKGISATLIDLAVRGYLKIIEEKKWWGAGKDYKFEYIKDWKNDSNLKDYEKDLLNAMFKEKGGFNKFINKFTKIRKDKEEKENVVSTKDLRMNMFGKRCREIFKTIYKGIVEKGIFTSNPSKLSGIFMGLGIFMVMGSFWLAGALLGIFNKAWIAVGTGLSGIVIFIFGILMPQKTFQGAEDKYKWLCFKEYLKTAEKFRLEASTLDNFEKYLPYAMVMGVEKKWAKRFELVQDQMHAPLWYVSRNGANSSFINSGGGFSPTGFSKSMSSMVSSFVSSSGGGAGGGGCAGGGGGGGGGGAG